MSLLGQTTPDGAWIIYDTHAVGADGVPRNMLSFSGSDWTPAKLARSPVGAVALAKGWRPVQTASRGELHAQPGLQILGLGWSRLIRWALIALAIWLAYRIAWPRVARVLGV